MKLSELKTTNLYKVLLYGDAGVGKTCFAAGFPGPTLYFDFDNKISSAARFFAKDASRLEGIEVATLGDAKISPMEAFLMQCADLEKQMKSGQYKYKTVVLDSITTFSKAMLDHIIKTNPGIKRVRSAGDEQPCQQDYGILKRAFETVIPGLLKLDMNVIMLGHITTDKDELTGEMIRGVMMDGSFSQKLPIYFEEVWRAYVEEKNGVRQYLAQTQSDGRYKCRSQIPGLPAVIPLKYETLTKQN